jgi:adenylate cyclase
LRAAADMHRRQAEVDLGWSAKNLESFGMGIGLSTGEVAAALLGSDERLEYTLVGDTVNLAQRLQDLARPEGTTVASAATAALAPAWSFERLDPVLVKGRAAPVMACRVLDSPEGASP